MSEALKMKMYAKIGTADVTICLPYNKPADHVEVTTTRPDIGYIVDGSGDWVLDPTLDTAELQRRAILEKWPMAKQIQAYTEQQAGHPEAYEQMVADIAAIKEKYK